MCNVKRESRGGEIVWRERGSGVRGTGGNECEDHKAILDSDDLHLPFFQCLVEHGECKNQTQIKSFDWSYLYRHR